MKKRLKIIGGLVLLLAACVGLVAVFVSQENGSAEELRLSIEPFEGWGDGQGTWRFAEADSEIIDEKLLDPARGKFGFTEAQEAFARCSSFVDYALIEDPAQPVFEDGYYYGTLMVYMGCEGPTSYSFRISLDGSTAEVMNADGNFVSMDEWTKGE